MWETLSSVNWGDVALWCAVIVLILVGIAGTIVPALPGHPMIFAGGLPPGSGTIRKSAG